MRALLFMLVLSARQRLAERGAVLARVSFYAVILFVLSRLWEAVFESAGDTDLQSHQVVWYLAITEWIVLSAPPIHTDVEDEVRRGDLVYRLARPVAYPLARLAEGTGDLLVRMGTMAVAGFGLACLLTGQLPTEPRLMLWLIPLGLLAGLLTLLMFFIIGLTSFWLHDCRPIYWIWQKCGFILGGLLVPLSLYPPWLRSLAIDSPFAAIIYGPGSIALGLSSAGALEVLLRLAGWIVITALLLHLTFRRSLARLEIGGG